MLLDRKKKLLPLLGYFGLLILIVVAAFLTGKQGGGETIKEVMKDAVLHEDNRIAFLGGMTVNPGLISAYTVTGILLLFAAVMRIFVIPVTTTGRSMSMPAPLSDINGAIAMGCVSYLVILSGGIASNGFRGVGSTLKEFSLPISMSFRLFGAMLSGLLVTELVYYTIMLSIVLPVIVAVLFTLLHALIQTYVLTMLTSVFYAEVSEPHQKKK